MSRRTQKQLQRIDTYLGERQTLRGSSKDLLLNIFSHFWFRRHVNVWHTPKFKIKGKTCSHRLPISEHVPPLFKTPYQVLLSLVCNTQSFGWLFRMASVWLLCPLTSCLSPGALQLLSSASSSRCLACAPLPGLTNPIQPPALSPSAVCSQRTRTPLF